MKRTIHWTLAIFIFIVLFFAPKAYAKIIHKNVVYTNVVESISNRVVIDQSGGAIVYTFLTIRGNRFGYGRDDNVMTELKVIVPDGNFTLFSYQVFDKKNCYKERVVHKPQSACEDTTPSLHDFYDNYYAFIQPQKQNNTYVLELPHPIIGEEEGKLLLIYTIDSIVTDNVRGLEYDFIPSISFYDTNLISIGEIATDIYTRDFHYCSTANINSPEKDKVRDKYDINQMLDYENYSKSKEFVREKNLDLINHEIYSILYHCSSSQLQLFSAEDRAIGYKEASRVKGKSFDQLLPVVSARLLYAFLSMLITITILVLWLRKTK